jgi:hypothetical protein
MRWRTVIVRDSLGLLARSATGPRPTERIAFAACSNVRPPAVRVV